jgi:hypothetical protein
MATRDTNILAAVPSSDAIRRRLAEVLTEADLLRSQLRVSIRLERERTRLREHPAREAPHGSR